MDEVQVLVVQVLVVLPLANRLRVELSLVMGVLVIDQVREEDLMVMVWIQRIVEERLRSLEEDLLLVEPVLVKEVWEMLVG
jgi:hypothetical protein